MKVEQFHVKNQFLITSKVGRMFQSYQSAIDSDPDYAIAYAHMAICFHDLSYFMVEPEKNIAKAVEAVNKALELDDENSECQYAMGRMKFWYYWDYDAAVDHFNKAIRINPNNVEAHQQLGSLYMKLGKIEEGHHHLSKADALDPFSLVGLFYICAAYHSGGDMEKVVEYANRLISLEPNFSYGYLMAATEFFRTHQYDKAITLLEQAVKLNGDIINLCYLAVACAKSGEVEKTRELLEKMNQLTSEDTGAYAFFGHVYASMGEWDRAIELYEQAIEMREGHMIVFSNEMRFYFPEMKDDPRISHLLEKVGLPV